MAYFKWLFRGLVVLLVFGFFHYTLAQHDVVRIVNTYEERQELNDWTRIFWQVWVPFQKKQPQMARLIQCKQFL